MPHLRFTRDKRGYENTYVVHAVRRRGKSRQRILYWFRTPPNVRVGRAALDEGAIRTLEEQNPEIGFDWTKILEAQRPPAPAEPGGRRRRPRREVEKPAQAKAPRRTRGARRRAAAAAPAGAPTTPAEAVARAATAPADEARPAPEPPELPAGVEAGSDRSEGPAVVPESETEESDAAEQAAALVPVTVYHGGADVLVTPAGGGPRVSPIEARLGSEQLGRVRARYAEILARITERAGEDPARLDELRQAADLLNPDGWVTDAEIEAGLRQFDTRLGEIRRVLGIKRRRRSRRGGRRRRSGERGRSGGPGPAGPGSEASNSLAADDGAAAGEESEGGWDDTDE